MNRRSFVRIGGLGGFSLAVSGLAQPVQTPQLPEDSDGNRPDRRQSGIGSDASSTSVTAYAYPRTSPQSSVFKVRADGQEIFVYRTSVGSFAAFGCKGAVAIEIEVSGRIGNVRIAPARHGIIPKIVANHISFQLPGPLNLWIEIDGIEHLFLYANAGDQLAPAPGAPRLRYFRGGEVHEAGEIRLGDNETLYLEGGAVVRGCIRATGARNVRIAGPGVLDGSCHRQGVDGRRSIVLEDCRPPG